MGQMDRTRTEFGISAALALAAMIVPMTWWLRVGLLIALSSVVVDLILRGSYIAKYHLALRAAGSVFAVAFIAFLSWKPISEEYTKEGGLAGLHDFLYSTTFMLAVAAAFGALIGNQFVPVRWRRQRRPVPWPNVAEWYSVTNAIDQFVDVGLRQNFVAARSEANAARSEFGEVQAKTISQDSGTALERLGYGSRSPDWDKAFERQYKAEEVEKGAIAALFEDLRRKLMRGALAARAIMKDQNKLPDEWVYFKPANWVGLSFDVTKIGTVQGGGNTYEAVEIGKQESTK